MARTRFEDHFLDKISEMKKRIADLHAYVDSHCGDSGCRGDCPGHQATGPLPKRLVTHRKTGKDPAENISAT